MNNSALLRPDRQLLFLRRQFRGEIARKNFTRFCPRNLLKSLISDERIQGNPRESNTSERGISHRDGHEPRASKRTHRTVAARQRVSEQGNRASWTGGPRPHTSRFATLSALSWMNSRRGSTMSPISC